jgi:hypothetical protein
VPPPGNPIHRPAIDERLIVPETRYEVVDGEVVYVSPADPPHASRHSKLSALLEAYAADGFDAASDMLTRTSSKGDMAPDGSIYPSAPDPETGGRQLEVLAFEVVSTESLGAAGRKAAALVGRGVRRVFALDVERVRALEWSVSTDAWEILSPAAVIGGPALVLPLPVHDLVSAAKADDAVARALLAKRNPVLVQAIERSKTEARAEGKAEARAEALLAVLAGRRIDVSKSERSRILATRDDAVLARWLAAAGTCSSASELLAGDRP